MHTIRELINVQAPIERCFELSIRLDIVQRTLGMKLISGPQSGSVAENSRVHWRGWKFGWPSDHHTLITVFQPPRIDRRPGEPNLVAVFQDSQERGRFATFVHDHYFSQRNDKQPTPHTLLEDQVRFSLPWYLGGRISEELLVGPYIGRLVRKRLKLLKHMAEDKGSVAPVR